MYERGSCFLICRFYSCLFYLQAPLLNAETAVDASDYMYLLNAVFESSYEYARFVWTGSSMAAFRQNLTPNRVSIWLSSEHILLGRPSSPATEREVMSIIFNHYSQNSRSFVPCSFSSDQLLDVIKSHKQLPSMLHIRPAVLDIITAFLFSRTSPAVLSNLNEFTNVVHASISAVIQNSQIGSLGDVVRLLNDLEPWELTKIHKLAIGEPVTFSRESYRDRSLDQLVSLLSGLPMRHALGVATPRRQLLPPYSTYFSQLIAPDGTFTVDMEVLRLRRMFVPTKMFEATTRFFIDFSQFLSPGEQVAISRAVMERCAMHGIGIQTPDRSIRPVATLQELRQCHLMAELHRHTMECRAKNSKIKKDVDRQQPVGETESASVREGARPDSKVASKRPGIALLTDLRVMHAESFEPESDFKCLGWNLHVVDSIIRAAHSELQTLNLEWVTFNPDGSLLVVESLVQPIRARLAASLKKKTLARKL